MQQASIPKGTRDYSPDEMRKRNYIFGTLREVFGLYGFQEIGTPVMENLGTLLGKYGEEGDKLVYKILNSGDYLREVEEGELRGREIEKISSKIAKKGLRYDLTVPFARYVAQHRQEVRLPFRRYQIGAVWRADRPQRGRYREFYQCDADIIGSKSLLNEVELLEMIDRVYGRLGLKVVIKINNRKILGGLSSAVGHPEKMMAMTRAMDKLDKIGMGQVEEELRGAGFGEGSIVKLREALSRGGSNEEKVGYMGMLLGDNALGREGLEEIKYIMKQLDGGGLSSEIAFDLSLSRGLDYYTGTIFEVQSLEVGMGSITGGGRYDNLTDIFGMGGVSGVGVSFGAERIYDVLNQVGGYPEGIEGRTSVLFLHSGEAMLGSIRGYIRELRGRGVSVELYPDASSYKKQLEYADRAKIRWVAIVGTEEVSSGKITLKEMSSGAQRLVTIEELVGCL